MLKKLFVIFLLTCLPAFPQTKIINFEAGGNSVTGTSSAVNDTGANFWALCMPTFGPNDGGASNISIQTSCNSFSTIVSDMWNPLTYYQVAADVGVRIWYSTNSTACSTHSFRWSSVDSGATYSFLDGAAFSGMLTSGVLDQDIGLVGGASSVTTIQPTSITPASGGGRLVFACGSGYPTGSTLTLNSIDSGFSLLTGQAYTAGTIFGGGGAYLVEASGGVAVNPTFTFSATMSKGAASIASFKGTSVTATNAIPVVLEK